MTFPKNSTRLVKWLKSSYSNVTESLLPAGGTFPAFPQSVKKRIQIPPSRAGSSRKPGLPDCSSSRAWEYGALPQGGALLLRPATAGRPQDGKAAPSPGQRLPSFRLSAKARPSVQPSPLFRGVQGKFDPKGGEAVTVRRACSSYGHRTQRDFPCRGPGQRPDRRRRSFPVSLSPDRSHAGAFLFPPFSEGPGLSATLPPLPRGAGEIISPAGARGSAPAAGGILPPSLRPAQPPRPGR